MTAEANATTGIAQSLEEYVIVTACGKCRRIVVERAGAFDWSNLARVLTPACPASLSMTRGRAVIRSAGRFTLGAFLLPCHNSDQATQGFASIRL